MIELLLALRIAVINVPVKLIILLLGTDNDVKMSGDDVYNIGSSG